jgi:hypothetical protein
MLRASMGIRAHPSFCDGGMMFPGTRSAGHVLHRLGLLPRPSAPEDFVDLEPAMPLDLWRKDLLIGDFANAPRTRPPCPDRRSPTQPRRLLEALAGLGTPMIQRAGEVISAPQRTINFQLTRPVILAQGSVSKIGVDFHVDR